VATEEMMRLPKSTSRPPDFPPDQRRLFREVLTLFNRHRLPYVVSGAFALHEHTGIWRDTKDLDLFLPGEYAVEALQVLKDDGFETEVADDVWIAKAHSNGFSVDLITGMSNAAVTVEMSWVERGGPCWLFGVPTRVLGAEELIASKVYVTRRERFDGADICHVIYCTKGMLDWQYLMRLLSQHGEHWEILFWHLVLFRYVYPASSHFVPRWLWQELLTRFRREVTRPDPEAAFRGSLIDENMFFIDVMEWGLPNLIEDLRGAREPKIPLEAANKLKSAA
jgi:hypothetical protein